MLIDHPRWFITGVAAIVGSATWLALNLICVAATSWQDPNRE